LLTNIDGCVQLLPATPKIVMVHQREESSLQQDLAVHRRLDHLGELGSPGDHEGRGLEHDVTPGEVQDLVGWRGLRLDGPDAADQRLVEQAERYFIERYGTRHQRFRGHVAQVEHRLRIIDSHVQPTSDLDLGGEALVRGEHVNLGPRKLRRDRHQRAG
jgi:hypothetical protein